ncbi:hypothetical protein LTR10_009455 [Elasticomyces elasticus]|nr:hypothetical protein LTR10_009455 [Elasticomyces elasticus]
MLAQQAPTVTAITPLRHLNLAPSYADQSCESSQTFEQHGKERGARDWSQQRDVEGSQSSLEEV